MLFIALDLLLRPLGLNGIFSYADEILIVLYFLFLFSHYRHLKKSDSKIIGLLSFSILIGLCSNYYSELVHNMFSIGVDVLWLSKIPISFIGMKYIAMLKTFKGNPLSKCHHIFFVLILIIAFYAILTLFVNTGMSTGERYGIPSFSFIYNNSGLCGMWCCIFYLLFLQGKKKSKWMIRSCEIAVVLIVILTTKGIPFMAIGIYIILILMSGNNKKNAKISFKKAIIIVPLLFVMSSFQINSYIKDINSPRMTLAVYGVKTANSYAPFGSGFATYGSEMAIRNYSPLYVRYGFDGVWGLQETTYSAKSDSPSFLNDIYYFSIIAQLGWLGFACFFCSLIYIFYNINRMHCNIREKSICIGIVSALYIAGIASGMTKTSMSVFAFSIIGYLVGYHEKAKYIFSKLPLERKSQM